MTNEAALYGAIVRGNLDVIQDLIAKDRSLLRRFRVAKSWLHWAAQVGTIEMMEFFVNAGIPVDELTEDGTDSPLDIAAGKGKLDACRWLIDHGADVNHGLGAATTPLFSAIYGRSLDVVKLFVEKGADLNAVFGKQAIDAIQYAEQYGTPEIVEFLKQRKG